MSQRHRLESESIEFQTTLHNLIDANLVYCLPDLLGAGEEKPANLSPAQLKKAARLELSVRLSSETIGFLHAALIEVGGKNYLLAGGSGVGKSTYGKALIERYGGQVLANDWVAVEKDDENFFVSDVNYAEQIKHPDRCQLDGLIFLTKTDSHRRDAFAPNPEELKELLGQTFDTASPEQLALLQSFWEKNWGELPRVLAVPTRQNEQKYVEETLINLLEREKSLNNRVGIIGLGSIGAELAFQLGQMPSVDQIHLYNRTSDKAVGYALDMNQAVAEKGQTYFAHDDAREVFANSDVVFFCFRDPQAGGSEQLPERWGKAAAHAQIMAEYARIASEQNFQGTIFVITNPVDVLSFALYQQSQQTERALRTYQVYGVGLELDRARAIYYAQQTGLDLLPEQIQVYGNHADTFVLNTPLSPDLNEQLHSQVAQASPEIRQYVPRTVYGPIGAAKQALLALQNQQKSTLTVIQDGSFIGRPIDFNHGLPMVGPSSEEQHFQEVLEKNKKVSLS